MKSIYTRKEEKNLKEKKLKLCIIGNKRIEPGREIANHAEIALGINRRLELLGSACVAYSPKTSGQ